MQRIDLLTPSNALPGFRGTEDEEFAALFAQAVAPAAGSAGAWPGAEAYVENMLSRLFPGGVKVGAGLLTWLGAIAGGALSSSFGEYLVGVATGRIPPEISARELQFAGGMVQAMGIQRNTFERLSPEGKVALVRGFAAIAQDGGLNDGQKREAASALFARVSGGVVDQGGRVLPGPSGLSPQDQDRLGLTGRPPQPGAAPQLPRNEGFPTGREPGPLVMTSPGSQPEGIRTHTVFPRGLVGDLEIQRTVFPAMIGGPSSEPRDSFANPARLPQILTEIEMLANSARPVATPKAGQNLALLEYDLEGVTGSLPSISGNRRIPGFAPPVPANQALLPPLYPNRQADTEYKLLNWLAENIEAHLDGEQTGGRVALYSKYTVCQSCAEVIRQFQQMYPRISVTVIHGSQERGPVNLSDPLPGRSRPNQ